MEAEQWIARYFELADSWRTADDPDLEQYPQAWMREVSELAMEYHYRGLDDHISSAVASDGSMVHFRHLYCSGEFGEDAIEFVILDPVV